MIGVPMRAAGLAAGLCLLAPAAWAQSGPASYSPGALVPPAPLDLPVQSASLGSALQLSGGTEESTVQLLLQGTISNPGLRGRTEGYAVQRTLSATLSAPLTKGDGKAELPTFARLGDDAQVKFRFTSFSRKIRRPSLAEAAEIDERWLETARANCRAKRPANPDAECAAETQRQLFLAEHLLPAEYRAYRVRFLPRAPAFAWGIEGGASYGAFDYLDPLGGPNRSERRWSGSAKLFGAVYPPDGRSALTASAEWQRNWTAADEGTLCPAPASPPADCRKGALGPPKRTDRAVLSLGARAQIDMPGFVVPRAALAPSLNYETGGRKFGFDLPVYLVADKDGALNGGLRIGYTTKDKNVSFGIFLGAPFALFQ